MGGVWATAAQAANNVPVLITGLAACQDGSLLYSMETDSVSGIFLLDTAGVETRLFHTADFRIRHAALDRDGAMVAGTAFHNADMRSNIAVVPFRGTDLSEVTEGDSFDQLPQWVPGPKRRIVFQSAGVGRDAAGRFAGLGPCAIQELDLDSGELSEICSVSGHDLLQPRKMEDGTLFYIRKPYESGVPKPTVAGSLKDTLLFPFRMGRALFQYFNIFSMMYTGKPLVTNKGAVGRRIDPRQAFINGNLAIANMPQVPEDEDQPLAPASWELVRHRPGGQTEVIAGHVLAFDVARDGSALYSDGTAIRRVSREGHSERVLQGEMIERVLAL